MEDRRSSDSRLDALSGDVTQLKQGQESQLAFNDDMTGTMTSMQGSINSNSEGIQIVQGKVEPITDIAQGVAFIVKLIKWAGGIAAALAGIITLGKATGLW